MSIPSELDRPKAPSLEQITAELKEPFRFANETIHQGMAPDSVLSMARGLVTVMRALSALGLTDNSAAIARDNENAKLKREVAKLTRALTDSDNTRRQYKAQLRHAEAALQSSSFAHAPIFPVQPGEFGYSKVYAGIVNLRQEISDWVARATGANRQRADQARELIAVKEERDHWRNQFFSAQPRERMNNSDSQKEAADSAAGYGLAPRRGIVGDEPMEVDRRIHTGGPR